jgi:hypothetical protein
VSPDRLLSGYVESVVEETYTQLEAVTLERSICVPEAVFTVQLSTSDAEPTDPIVTFEGAEARVYLDIRSELLLSLPAL